MFTIYMMSVIDSLWPEVWYLLYASHWQTLASGMWGLYSIWCQLLTVSDQRIDIYSMPVIDRHLPVVCDICNPYDVSYW